MFLPAVWKGCFQHRVRSAPLQKCEKTCQCICCTPRSSRSAGMTREPMVILPAITGPQLPSGGHDGRLFFVEREEELAG